MLRFAPPALQGIARSIDAAAAIHDLGKLAKDNQTALRAGRGTRLKIDHVDAGVAHALAAGNDLAAWLIRSHHSPGLPSRPEEEANLLRRGCRPPLRGVRWPDASMECHERLIGVTDKCLSAFLERHRAAAGDCALHPAQPIHGLPMRLALSCLVDADHEDSARHDTLADPPTIPPTRWVERIAALDNYVATLARKDPRRDIQRSALYEACRVADHAERIVSCQAAVGLGKTTAVTRYLLGQAAKAEPPLRRLFVIAPFTNIITQTVATLRNALVLPGENAHSVVAEHHHRVDFDDEDHRTLATLWRAPVVVTTAVQFFETLGANRPAELRKLHEVPGSAIFIDEAHAAIPVHLWPQCWRWLRELADQWSCRIVLASGSLVRFWQEERIIAPACNLPELTPGPLLRETQNTELARVSVCEARPTGNDRRALTRSELVEHLTVAVERVGPVLAILNTVQSAAVIACDLAERLDGITTDQHPHPRPITDRHVLHLSTALTPRDRDEILEEIGRRQRSDSSNYVLIATSIVEAGVDLDFRTGFRERASVSAFIQTSGRVNRHGLRAGAALYTFQLEHDNLLKAHPAFRASASIFDQLWPALLAGHKPGDLATEAMSAELDRRGGIHEQLSVAELASDYPKVAELCRVIDSDTRLVVVDDDLKLRLEQYERVSFKELQEGSVQLWAAKIDSAGLPASPLSADIYLWNDAYDPLFLGYMAGLLRGHTFVAAGGGVV